MRPTLEGLYGEMRALALEHREPELARSATCPSTAASRGAGTTLEYGVADFALALAADRLGHDRRRGALRR